MRVLITEKGATGPNGKPAAKNSEIDIAGDFLPAGLVNKCQILPESGKKPKTEKLIVNPKTDDLADLKKQAGELGIDGADGMDAATLQAAIDAKLAA